MYNSFRTQKHWRVSTKSNASTQLKHKQSFGFFKTCLHSCFFKADNNSLLKDCICSCICCCIVACISACAFICACINACISVCACNCVFTCSCKLDICVVSVVISSVVGFRFWEEGPSTVEDETCGPMPRSKLWPIP